MMEDRNSLQYLNTLRDSSRNRYSGKPQKPIKAEVAQKQQHNHLLPYDVLMQLYREVAGRLNSRGIRPLPYIPAAEDELNEAWRICLLGWADLDYFKQALAKWSRITGGDSSSYQEELAF